MSIFGDIWQKITSVAESAAPSAAAADTSSATVAPTETGGAAAPTGSQTPAPVAMSEVDVEMALTKLSAEKGDGDSWRTSIVDMLKVLGLDSSLTARTELAHELDVHAGADGSAEQNIALHRAVIQKMEENGGKVPDSMKG